jgi:hypothetical protein
VDHLAALSDVRLACGHDRYPAEVKVVNVATGACEYVLPLDGGDIIASLVALPHNRVAYGSKDGIIKVWHAT